MTFPQNGLQQIRPPNYRAMSENGWVLGLLIFPTVSCAAPQPRQPAVEAADKFLSTLTAPQRGKVVYSWSDDGQRARWSNFPTGMVPRGGLSLKEMTEPQKAAAFA